MKSKVEQLKRIERLRKRLHELSTWKHSMMAQERDKLASAHAAMVTALGDGIMSYGELSVAGTRRVRQIERELAVASALTRELESRALADGRMAKLAESSLDTARETWRDASERKSLLDLIDASVASGTGSRKS